MYFHYVPKYEDLEFILKAANTLKDPNIYFYFDFKNGLYVIDNEVTADNVFLHMSELVTTTFRVIPYITKWFTEKNQYDKDKLHFIFFCETGKSLYHRRIDQLYKKNRLISDDIFRPDKYYSTQAIMTGISYLENSLNFVKNVWFYVGKYMEFDFIPYYFIKEKTNPMDLHIVMSSDKDHYQLHHLLDDRYIYQLEKMTTKNKWHPGRMFINKENYIERLYRDIKLDHEIRNIVHKYYNLIRAIFGDSGDGIQGVKGIGPKTFFNKIFPEIKSYFLDMEEIYSIVTDPDTKYKDNELFFLSTMEWYNDKLKRLKKFQTFVSSSERISKNLRLMDYRIISNIIIKNSIKYIKDLESTKKDKTIEEVFSELLKRKLIDPSVTYLN